MMRWVALCLSVTTLFGGEDWPQFRGPGGQGYTEASGLPLSWSDTQNVRWRTELPGRGFSSPVVLSNQVWVTVATDNEQSLRAVGLDRDSGRILFNIEVFRAVPERLGSALSGLASPTPVLEPGRLYVCFGTYGTACVATDTGKVLWQNNRFRFGHDNNGPGSSPIVHDGLLILTCDGTNVRYMTALDKNTGDIRWLTPRSNVIHTGPGASKSYGTPLVTPVDGQEQLISPGAHRVSAYEPLTGKEIWSCDLPGWSIVPRPVVGHGMVYICTGGDLPELWAIRSDGHGVVSDSHVAWKYKKQVPMVASTLLIGPHLYMVSTGGIATCLDAVKGTAVWTERLGGGDYYASLLYAQATGLIYSFSNSGRTTVFKAEPTFNPVATNALGDGFMASAAVAGKAFYLRSRTHLYRIEP